MTIGHPALLVLGLFAVARIAEACTCVTGDPHDENKVFRESRQRAVLVFAGKVVALQTSEEGSYLGANVRMNHTVATFTAYRVWKGPKAETVQVHFRSSPQSALCEYPFVPDTEYLVFAYGDEPSASACDFTMPLADQKAASVEGRLGKASWKRAP